MSNQLMTVILIMGWTFLLAVTIATSDWFPAILCLVFLGINIARLVGSSNES